MRRRPGDLPAGSEDGRPGQQTPAGRAYGGDSWGFGMFPGQYAMALLVRRDFEVLHDGIRTFQNFRWDALPDPLAPIDPESGEPWYCTEAWSEFRLSSKTHVDIPVRVAAGTILHVLASHPTPPAFDGPEARNKRRNHDEIRFWHEYLSDKPFIVDDAGVAGGLKDGAHFVIVGDLNADPDEGSSINDPIGSFLLAHPRVNGQFVPEADLPVPDLDPDDTARWGLRVDYVLPSTTLTVLGGEVHRHSVEPETQLSDHFPVWLDLKIPVPQ